MRRTQLGLVLGFVLSGLSPLGGRTAHAQVGTLGVGSRAIALGNAFTGVADDLSAAYYNPAGLTQLIEGGARGSVSMSFNKVNMHYSQPIVDERSQVEPGQQIGARTGAPAIVMQPSLNGGLPIGDDLYLVPLPLLVPFAGAATFDADRGDARFLAIEGTQLAITWSPTIAYRVTDWLSIGGGFDLSIANHVTQQSKIGDGAIGRLAAKAIGVSEDSVIGRLLSTVDGMDDAEVRAQSDDEMPLGLDPVNDLNIDMENWGYHLGVMVWPTEWLRIGISYRSELNPGIEGHATYTLASNIEENPLFRVAGLASETTRVVIPLPLPQVVSAGISAQLGDEWMVAFTWWWEDWASARQSERVLFPEKLFGVISEIAVAKKYESPHQLRAGVEWRPEPWLRLMSGAWWQPSNLSDEQWDFLGDGNDRLSLSFGLGLVELLDGCLDLYAHFQYSVIQERHIQEGESVNAGGTRELALPGENAGFPNDGFSLRVSGDVINFGLTLELRV